ncbi:bifunctional lysylphosphatidylglycerol flippase/synthetase MprF [Microvirga terrae]|uniref:Bifunctional lysylphosphatidylglycerol flippase/synthetase MprF n=1 Tax=Microvirga terrae TaxID=2740529 RepID=A0ABY5RN80_9HYPH|nr:bifunctional lysylphosphatidylglycerol flippase/synthetase MprF [Microvirga terrae]UVF18706.1 bifunctional lysylphosphatidylglycerol flippase/synthetase MprF [Microvirga terrae]
MPTTALRTAEACPAAEAQQTPGMAPAAEVTPSHRRPWFLRWMMPALALAGCGALAALLMRLVSGLDLATVAASALSTPVPLIGISLLLAVVSYGALIGYDAFGVRAATEKTVPLRTVALGSFTSYAIGHTLGFPLVTAGAVRWRIYGGAGLSLSEVAKLTAVAAMTLWVGMAGVLGLSAALEPQALAALDHLPTGLNRSLGIALLAGLAAYLAWSRGSGREIGRGRMQIRVPGGGAALVQIGLGLTDICAAAAALWVLLPADLGIGFPVFAAVFASAILLAVVSHVPAGLGAFEAAILLAFPQAPAAELLSAVLVWRLTYTLIPFLFAVALFLAHEVRRSDAKLTLAARRVRRLVLPFVPAALAILTFIGGLVLLTSGALPNDYSRVRALRLLVPLPFAEVSHLVGSTAGVVLLILSRGLMRRLASAWTLSIVVIGAGIVVSLAKGFDWEEALVLGAVLTLLLTHRSAFYRKAGIFAEPLEPRWLVAVAFILGCSLWLGFTAFQDVDYSHDLWWQFNWHDDASRFLRSSLGAIIIGAALSLYAMIHRHPDARRVEPLKPDALAPALACAERADAHLALLEDKRFLFHPSGEAFLMYAVRGKSWIAMGDPIGKPEHAADVMWQFLEEVDRHAGWPVFYQVSPTHLPLYLDGGLSLVKLGEEAHVDLETFTTEGKAGKDWRAALNRAKRENLEFAIIPAAEVPSHLAEFKSVSDAWLAGRGAGEKGFSIGFWSERYLSYFDVAVIRRDRRIVAFANIWYGQPGGEITIDLMRYLPGISGIMDLLFVSLMQEGKARGYRWFNLGMAPLSGLSEHRLAPSWHKVAAFVARNGERFYGFKGLRAYKEKFGPAWEPRYLASPGGWALPQILLDVSNLISGSPIKSISKGARS